MRQKSRPLNSSLRFLHIMPSRKRKLGCVWTVCELESTRFSTHEEVKLHATMRRHVGLASDVCSGCPSGSRNRLQEQYEDGGVWSWGLRIICSTNDPSSTQLIRINFIRFKSLHLIKVHLLRKPPAQAKPPFRPQASTTLRQTQRVLCSLLVARSIGHGIGDTACGILDSAASTLRCVASGIRHTFGGVASGFSDSTD